MAKRLAITPDSPPETDRLLTPNEAAGYLHLTYSTLEKWRWKRMGPRFRKHGGRVMYSLADLEAWSKSQTVTTAN